jgi:hypothetical protein
MCPWAIKSPTFPPQLVELKPAEGANHPLVDSEALMGTSETLWSWKLTQDLGAVVTLLSLP